MLGSALPFKDLLGLFIGQLKARGEAAAGQAFDAVVLGRPVFFVDDDPEADREAQDTLVQVANKLGFRRFPSSTNRSPRPSTTSAASSARNWS